jgi:hypothetical protein
LAKKESKDIPLIRDNSSYFDELLKRKGSFEGLDAFDELCHLGCDRRLLGQLLIFFGGHSEIRLKPTEHSEGRTISIRPLDSFETAFYPFKAISRRDLDSFIERTKRFLADVELLKQSAIVQELIAKDLIREGDILAGPPFLFTGPFDSLLNLPELIEKLDLKRSPDQTRLREQIHWHIFERTKGWHDNLVAAVFNDLPLFENEPTNAEAIKMWRNRHGCKTPKSNTGSKDM